MKRVTDPAPTRDQLLAMAYVHVELAEASLREFEVRRCREPALSREVASLEALGEYVEYYNRERCHLSLVRNAPAERMTEPRPTAEVHGTPVPGGLHHRYRAVA